MNTERKAILDYIAEFGEMTPAKMHAKVYNGHFFGSEVTRACRYLVAEGLLERRREGKFTVFYLSGKAPMRNENVEIRYVTMPNGEKREIVIHR